MWVTTFTGVSRVCQLAIAGRLTVGSSLKGRWFPASCNGHAGPVAACEISHRRVF